VKTPMLKWGTGQNGRYVVENKGSRHATEREELRTNLRDGNSASAQLQMISERKGGPDVERCDHIRYKEQLLKENEDCLLTIKTFRLHQGNRRECWCSFSHRGAVENLTISPGKS